MLCTLGRNREREPGELPDRDRRALRRPPGAQARRHGRQLRAARRGLGADRAACSRSKGFERGDRVGIMLPNVPYFAIVYYGVLRAGGVVVPMNVLLKGREVAFYLEDPGAKILFAWHDFAEAAQTGAEKAGAELILVKPGEFEQLLGGAEPDHDVADVDRRRHRGDPLHLAAPPASPRAPSSRTPTSRRTPRSPPTRSPRPPRRTSSSARCRCSTPSGRRAG